MLMFDYQHKINVASLPGITENKEKTGLFRIIAVYEKPKENHLFRFGKDE